MKTEVRAHDFAQTNHVTISLVSQRAGVSRTTVSRYLNGNYGRMSEKTKKRIERIIKELDYHPNALARGLKTKKSGLIGVILSDIGNPVIIQLIKGIINQCTKEGYQTVIASSDEDTEKEQRYLYSMAERQVEGIILNLVDYNEYGVIKSMQENGIKIVLADRTIAEPHFDTVTTDNYAMTRDTIKELYQSGYQTVGLFSSLLLKSNVRLARYNAFLDESKNHVDNYESLAYLFAENSVDEYTRALENFMDQSNGKKPAVFAATPMSLINLLNAVRSLKLCVPQDLGICGYDNLQWTKLVDGGITVVEQPFYEVGEECAKILIDRIKNGGGEPTKYVELKSRLIKRGSTELI